MNDRAGGDLAQPAFGPQDQAMGQHWSHHAFDIIGQHKLPAGNGRQGLGRTLMTHVLARAGTATVFLTATDFGLPLYRKLGFRTVGRNGNFTGTFRPLPGDGPDRTRAATGDDLATILEIDGHVFGADRGYLIRRLFSVAGQIRVLAPHGTVTGYAAAIPSEGQTIIGPVIAPDAISAQALIAGLASRIGGPVRTDLNPGRREMAGWAEAHGLPQVAETAFMVRGAWPLPGHREDLYAPITVALG